MDPSRQFTWDDGGGGVNRIDARRFSGSAPFTGAADPEARYFVHKKIGRGLKKAGKFVGKVAKKAALPVGLGLATGGLGLVGGGLLGKLGGGLLGKLGGLDIEKLLSIGGAGLGMFESIKQGRKKAGIQDQQRELADFQLAGGRELFEGGRDIRDASRQQLLARLQRGALAPPDMSGLRDTANPFRSRFNFDVSTPFIGALQPPGRKAQPVPAPPPPGPPPSRKARRRGGGRLRPPGDDFRAFRREATQ